MDELFDIVDMDDQVVGQAPREVVHRQGWLHRAVHILVFDTHGRLLLQMRSASKDESPLCYTSSASGHVEAGESYEETARRELLEELGLQGELEFLTKLTARPETANEHTAIYRVVSDGPIFPNRREIEFVEFVTLQEAMSRLRQEPEQFSPPFQVVLEWYVEHYPSY